MKWSDSPVSCLAFFFLPRNPNNGMTAALSIPCVEKTHLTRFLRHREIVISNTTTIRRPLVYCKLRLQLIVKDCVLLFVVVCGLSSNGV
jgi:hypothetical protein